MASTTGRRVVVPLTNKSGGGVIAGDVVIIDTATDDSFTTTTTAGFTGTVGIAQETIASNAVGQVLLAGEAALVNVSASVTRGHYGKTHTVAKQSVSAGASRTVGTFVQFKTGGTTPKGIVYAVDLAGATGNVATDAIWDAAGDLVQGTGADTGAKLTAGLTGQVLRSAGAAAANAWAYPPGYEFDYAEKTSNTSITATTEATANTIVTGAAVTYDGSTAVMVIFFSPENTPPAVAAAVQDFWLYDGSSSIGRIGENINPTAAQSMGSTVYCAVKITPSAAAHTYSIRSSVSSGTGTVVGGAGGNGNSYPAYIRIVKV